MNEPLEYKNQLQPEPPRRRKVFSTLLVVNIVFLALLTFLLIAPSLFGSYDVEILLITYAYLIGIGFCLLVLADLFFFSKYLLSSKHGAAVKIVLLFISGLFALVLAFAIVAIYLRNGPGSFSGRPVSKGEAISQIRECNVKEISQTEEEIWLMKKEADKFGSPDYIVTGAEHYDEITKAIEEAKSKCGEMEVAKESALVELSRDEAVNKIAHCHVDTVVIVDDLDGRFKINLYPKVQELHGGDAWKTGIENKAAVTKATADARAACGEVFVEDYQTTTEEN